jgi:hypothetical protein
MSFNTNKNLTAGTAPANESDRTDQDNHQGDPCPGASKKNKQPNRSRVFPKQYLMRRLLQDQCHAYCQQLQGSAFDKV